MPELTERAGSLFRFLRDRADDEGLVRGVTFETAPHLWQEAEHAIPDTGTGVHGVFQANTDDYPEAVAELVLKGRLDIVVRDGGKFKVKG